MYKILVIDDKQENHYLIAKIVKDNFPEAEVVSKLTGKEGIKAALKELPDVILLDLMMPEMDGFEVCNKLKSDNKTEYIPVLIISGVLTGPESKIKALDIGADAFLSKPVGPTELVAQIKAMLRIKKAEDKLRHENLVLNSTIKKDANKFDFSLEKYKKIFDNNFSGILETDLNGKIIFCNTAFAKMMGYKNIRELIGLNILDFYQNKSERDELLDILKRENRITNYNMDALDRNGNTLYVLVNIFLMDDKTILAFIVDLSSLKKSEKALQENEKKYKDLFDNINDFICTHDLNGKILTVNPAAEKLLGYTHEKILNKNFRDFLAPEVKDQFEDYIKKIKTEHKAKGLMLVQTRSGKKRVLEYDNTLCEDNIDLPFVRGFARDVTEFKQKTHLLKMSEKKYKDLFEKSDDAILIIKNKKFVDCNQATVKMLHYKNKNELLNTHPSQLSPEFQPDGKPSFEKADEMMNIAFKKGSHRFEWDHKKADGEVFPVEVLLTDVSTCEDEKILHTVWRDITDRKQVLKKLRENEEGYRNIFQFSNDGIIVHDLNGSILDANNMALKLFGYSKDELFLLSITDLYSKGSEGISKKAFETVERVGKVSFEINFKKKNGEYFMAEVSSSIIQISGKDVVLGIFRDITEKKKAAKIQNAIYSIAESTFTASDMFTLYKKIHEIISTLLPIKNIYIALYNEVTGFLSFPYFVDEYDPPQPDKKLGKGLTEYVLRTGKACLIDEKKDLELRAKGEVEIIGAPTKIWLGVPLKVSGKTIGVIVVQDYEDELAYGEEEKQLLLFISKQIAQVIERKQNSVQLKKYSEKLKEANRTKDKFFSIIAHDLKSPFQGLLGYSQILSDDYSTLSEEEKLFFIKNIDAISKNAYLLLEDLLTWSRLQTGKMEVNLKIFNLVEYINPTISLLSQTALNKEIKLNSFLDNKINVKADQNMLSTIIRNLISNAIKFTNNGGEISISSKPVENFVEINVADNGLGITKDKLDKLFTMDSNITTKGTANEEGTGLGLLLCKEMVEKQGGSIRVESEIGKGSKFIFTIPLNIE